MSVPRPFVSALALVLALASMGCHKQPSDHDRSDTDRIPSSYPTMIRQAIFTMILLVSALSLTAQEKADAFDQEQILALMKKVNAHTLENPYKATDRDWIRGTWYSGVIDAYHATQDPTYLEQAKKWAEKHQYQIGHEKSGFNRLFCSMTWLELYLLEPDPTKIASTIDGLKEDVPWSPTVGKVWYGHAPKSTQLNCAYADGLYSASVFAMLYKATGEQMYLDYLHDAFWRVTDTILDQEDDLYYRDPGYIGMRTAQGRKVLWSRGNGWVFSGLPRILRHLPKDDPEYPRYVDLFQRMAKAIAARQEDDGFWRANLGDDQDYKMPESSGTAFFVAGFGHGIREGHLDKETYLPVVIRAWDALVSAVRPNGLLGWVQPVDAKPRPSHPYTTQEYGTGLFLSAGSQVYRLVKDGSITSETVEMALRKGTQLLPPAALKEITPRAHPLHEEINAFLRHQSVQTPKPTGFTKESYLGVIAGQVKAMQPFQNAEGRIIDPVEKKEMYFTTPCYAHSVAALVKAKHPLADKVQESGMKALDVALADMASGKAPGNHGDFFTWPIVFAYELFKPVASPERKAAWKSHLQRIAPRRYRTYRKPPARTGLSRKDHEDFYSLYRGHFANNWNLVHVAGEWGRVQHEMGDPWYVDYSLTMQLANFTPYGLYNEKGNPLPYDLFARHYLTGMLQRGYDSSLHATYRDILWRGAWTSLFMQSPFGEFPTGYRSSHHIWNEAQQAMLFEIYAAAYAKAGHEAGAGALKRAARLSLASIKKWIRPDGSGYIVKNRYPIEAKHGYEKYSAHSCYNMLATSMLAQAWQFADDGIEEKVCPAEVGGFAFEIPTFHKIFANMGGNYLEYDTAGDQLYNPTGILRVHLENGHPQLGPSDGCARKFSGESLAIGSAWKIKGEWTNLAAFTDKPSKIVVLEKKENSIGFHVTCRGVSQTITLDEAGVTVTDTITHDGVEKMRVTFPMLVFDGQERTTIAVEKNKATMRIAGKGVTFTVLEPDGLTLQRSGKELPHRNGIIEALFAETSEKRIVYRISAE